MAGGCDFCCPIAFSFPLTANSSACNNTRHLEMSRSTSNKNKVATKPKAKAVAAKKKLTADHAARSEAGSQHTSSASGYMLGDRVSHSNIQAKVL